MNNNTRQAFIHEIKGKHAQGVYCEVNYVTPEYASLCVYAGRDKHVVEGLTSRENLQFLADSTRVTGVTVISEGGHIDSIDLQNAEDLVIS